MRISDWSSDVCSSDLTLMPLNFGVAGGTLGNTLTLDGNGDKIKAKLKTQARHLKLKKLFPGAESMDASFGELHGDGELSAQGRSVAELLGHSNGEVKALVRSEEHTSELQSLMRISYAVFCLKKKKT